MEKGSLIAKRIDTYVTAENVFILFYDRNIFTTANHLHSTFLVWYTLKTKLLVIEKAILRAKLRSKKKIHENELFFWKFALLNEYLKVCNIEQI